MCFGQDLRDEALDMVNQTAAQMYEDLAALKHLHELLSCIFPALTDYWHYLIFFDCLTNTHYEVYPSLRHSTSIQLCLEARGFLLCRCSCCCSGFLGFAEWFERLAAAATEQPPSCTR